MVIPQNITKDHLLMAKDKIDKEGIPKDADSQFYDVVINEKKYPPKLIVSYANIFANGSALDRNTFPGGIDTQCFKLLENHGFQIVKKSISYYLLGAAWYSSDNYDQTERFIENGIWENGYSDKLLDIVNGVKIGDRVAIKSSFATREGKSMLRIKAIGTVTGNVGDGRTINVKWDQRILPFDLEGFGAYRNTIQRVSDQDISTIFKSKDNMNYYPELKKFLIQAKTNELGVNEYIKNFQDLTVKVGFGKGNQARIPWIAFLKDSNRVQDGIYPVYLYYKDKELLILAFGISETNTPNQKWKISNQKSITEFFKDKNFGKPDRYGNSLVFKTYDISKPINEREIEEDLNTIISIYKESHIDTKMPIQKFQVEAFQNALSNANLFVSNKTSIRLISSLLSKPFVILTGLSGSGKTKLAQAFAMWICDDENQYCIVPVGADWTNREPLLGFPNSLRPNDYIKPDNKALDLVIAAANNPKTPYFLILDEMNLSHVERYFADFLSAMESKERISLHSGTSNWNNVPPQIFLPDNLFIIGTVNIDETTYMFSPKVLDRANVIEFRVTSKEMQEYLQSNSVLNLQNLRGEGSNLADSFISFGKTLSNFNETVGKFDIILLNFFAELKSIGAEFGFRSATEILKFAAVINKLELSWTTEEIIDVAIMQKLLPKVHGSRRKLEPVLKKLGSLCLTNPNDIDVLITKKENSEDEQKGIAFPISFEKIQRMYQNVISNGFTSYAEA